MKTEFKKWFRDYMDACCNNVELNGGSISGEQEIKDVSKKVEELLHCKKSVENGKATCGVKLDCHIHDWRQNDICPAGADENGFCKRYDTKPKFNYAGESNHQGLSSTYHFYSPIGFYENFPQSYRNAHT